MKRSVFAVALLASFSVFAQPSNLSVLKKSMNEMQPISIEESDSTVVIVLNTASVTPEIYDTAILGICNPVWLNKENTAYLKNTKEVHVLNKFSAIGYALEKPRATCEKAGQEQPKQSKITILSNTHTLSL
ncbi:TPA: hypothetical protein F6U11_18855 [Citrobacter freundii]|uniref:hypothetical protein n=1 Tax=Escherichia coli TaxID=562 RepID=UPI000FAA43D8|nr:hypothetical protein [Escherichia coli]EBD4887161.1 hypothetical protein [Salmonella enterica]ECC3553104.1 hypothetical protein [Salmonella enterica subsp. salamae]ECD2130218.1 hypothetical protein [Salmonella enterica subsp. enterica serovar Senftenberg]EID1645173.1 hypothetical protein [Salmonella enterica subsp. enterica serovar Napoli]HAU4331664.1 hypothetical protein [Citrobacter freundii]HED1354612.1 hypothetical protein [Citrobacter werkmanii]